MAVPAGGPSPAERFAAAGRRGRQERTELARFAAGLGFELDEFQRQGCGALEAGRGVLVAAPTGAGKTVVGEFAVHLALATGRKAFYTTPIKALSNQKYHDLVARHGEDAVGLLTGDTSVNGEAPVVVMTTEVLRNMLYAASPTLAGLAYVVMDEVHYLADRFRGPVWEEVIIHLPDDVLVVSLSATVSNAEEFGAWLVAVRGDTEVVVSEHRPVPLFQHVVVGRSLVDLFAENSAGEAVVNPDLVRVTRGEPPPSRGGRAPGRRGYRERGGGPRGGPSGRDRGGRYERGADGPGGAGGRGPGARSVPSRAEVVARLDDQGLLPAITFIFSRAGCQAAVRQCLASGLRLTTPAERAEILAEVQQRCAGLPEGDLPVLGYGEWLDGLQIGVAAHHAGMLPVFKEVVESLFARGLIKAVFATETLALGINMPARCVVLEKLVKFNGETHADVTPGEYTQLTGRAGRRGIDVEGHAVVVWHPGLDPESVAGLASTRTYPLRSSFRPTYNMAVNLVSQVGRAQARAILETSFAQFQADRAVVGMARQVRRQEEALAGYAEAMRCHLGDFGEYAALRRTIGELERGASREVARGRRADAMASLQRLTPGDVIRVPTGRRAGYAVVIDVAGPGAGDGPTVLTEDRQVRRIPAADVPAPVQSLARVRIPRTFNARNPAARRDLASSLRASLPQGRRDPDAPADGGRGDRSISAAATQRLDELRRRLRAHPCHGCAEREDHARWAVRWAKLRSETDAVAARVESRTNTIAVTFDRVCSALKELGYLTPADDGAELALTAAGERLRRIYTEKDLLVAECLRQGAWSRLDGPGMAAVASAIVYEARSPERGMGPRTPGGPVRVALDATVKIWSDLQDMESRLALDLTGEPDVGMAYPVHRWAQGRSLDEVLRDEDLSAGDFVRRCRQIVDLLGQVAQAGDASGDRAVARAARAAMHAVDRGVVAGSGV